MEYLHDVEQVYKCFIWHVLIFTVLQTKNSKKATGEQLKNSAIQSQILTIFILKACKQV